MIFFDLIKLKVAIGRQVTDPVERKVEEELADVYANTNWTVY